ncbi:MAG: 2'-5' RNA ligase family protein [Candidatus Hodarchaeota archaeon]
MPYAIVLTFDEESNHIITYIFRRFKNENISPILHDVKMKPHITLSIYENIDINIVKERLLLFSIETKPFKIQISSIGYFPSEESVLFLNPKASIELLNFQQKAYNLFKNFKTKSSPITWIPHCTLGINIQMENLPRAIDIIKEEILITEEKPYYITGEAISFVKFKRDPLKIDWWLDYKLKK